MSWIRGLPPSIPENATRRSSPCSLELDLPTLLVADPRVLVRPGGGRRLPELPLLFEPGTKHAYSAYNFVLLSAAIEGASGQEAFYIADLFLGAEAACPGSSVGGLGRVQPLQAR